MIHRRPARWVYDARMGLDHQQTGWLTKTSNELEFGVHDPDRLREYDNLFTVEPQPISPEAARLASDFEEGNIEHLTQYLDDDGNLTGDATRMLLDAWETRDRASA